MSLLKKKENNRSRPRRRLSAMEKLILAVPVAAAVLAVLVVVFVMDRGSTYEFTEDAHQYYGGSMAAVPAGSKLKSDETGQVKFVDGPFDEGTDTFLPVYMDNSPAVVLTADMTFYMPRTGQYGRVPALSHVECQPNGMIHITRESYSSKPNWGFLYDGGDFYLFLEPVIIRYMNYAVELPALSYAEVHHGGQIMLFDYGTRSFVMETLEGTATAESLNGEYKISLLGDSMTDYNGELTLLVSRPGEIDILE